MLSNSVAEVERGSSRVPTCGVLSLFNLPGAVVVVVVDAGVDLEVEVSHVVVTGCAWWSWVN